MFHWLYKKTKDLFQNIQTLNLTNRKVIIEGIYYGTKLYYFKKQLGKGAFGAVYEAIDPYGKHVAVKVTNLRDHPADADILQNPYFLSCKNEAEILYNLTIDHKEKHVVQVYEVGVDADWSTRPYVYIIMEMGQENLDNIITNMHNDYAQACNMSYSNEYIPSYYRRLIWKQLVQCVAALQRHNIAHLDLKPGNIIRVGKILKVCDLGLSKYGSGFGGGGTPNFSAPEALLLEGKFHPKVDIWSIGAILYYMTYGKQPSWNPENRSWEPPYGQAPVQDSCVQELLEMTLQHDATKRPSIGTLLQHPYTIMP